MTGLRTRGASEACGKHLYERFLGDRCYIEHGFVVDRRCRCPGVCECAMCRDRSINEYRYVSISGEIRVGGIFGCHGILGPAAIQDLAEYQRNRELLEWLECELFYLNCLGIDIDGPETPEESALGLISEAPYLTRGVRLTELQALRILDVIAGQVGVLVKAALPSDFGGRAILAWRQ